MEGTSGIGDGSLLGMTFDIIILGAGPGGIRAAKVLAAKGKRVALVSNDLGGECLNYGCIPTKTYLWTAELFEKISSAGALGIETTLPKINWVEMKKRQKQIVDKLKRGLTTSLELLKVTIIEGNGILKDAHTVEVGGNVLQSDYIILATGSESSYPPGITKSEKNITSREILDLPALPKTLLIIGAGAIGVEFASLFSVLGTSVTLSEIAPRILPMEDPEVSAELERIFVRRNIKILKGTKITPDQFISFDYVLVATGRKSSFDKINLDAASIQHDEKQIPTNEKMQTNIPHIFVIGDLAGKSLLAYTAEREAEIAARFILGENSQPLNYTIVANTIFSLPEVASVGLNESKLEELAIPYRKGKALVSANAKALIMGDRDGFAKILAEKNSHKILGVHLIGPKVSELIGEASLALSAEITLEVFNKNIHSHPILGEILKEACEIALNGA